MKRFGLGVLLIGMIQAWLGCAALNPSNRINQQMNSWINLPESDLIARWGPPNSMVNDGNGGRILIYLFDRHYQTADTRQAHTRIDGQVDENGRLRGTATTTISGDPPVTYEHVAKRMFYVNRDGKIYAYRWRGW